MAREFCFHCSNSFDPLTGHFCNNGVWVPGVKKRNLPIKENAKEQDIFVQEPRAVNRDEIYGTTMINTGLANIQVEVSNEIYSSDKITYGNDDTSSSIQDSEVVQVPNRPTEISSESSLQRALALIDLNSYLQSHDLARNECYNSMVPNYLKCEMESHINQQTRISCQSGFGEDTVIIPSITKYSKYIPDLATLNPSISLQPDECQKLEVLKLELMKKHDNSKLINNFTVSKEKTDCHFAGNYKPAVQHTSDISVQICSINDQLTGNRNQKDSLQYKYNYTPIERKLGSNESSSRKENNGNLTSLGGISYPDNSNPLKNFPVNDAPSISCSSFSRLEKICDSMNLKGLQPDVVVEEYSVDCTNLTQFSCNVCQKLFTKIHDFDKHMLMHKAAKPCICDICGKSFELKHNLKRHIRIHTDKKPCICEICGKGFRGKYELKSHAFIHAAKKPYKCEVCTKSFARSQGLKSHSLIHTSIKSYACENCGKSFSRLHNLKQHNLIHTGKKPHECKICKKTFLQKSNFKRHLKMHNPK